MQILFKVKSYGDALKLVVVSAAIIVSSATGFAQSQHLAGHHHLLAEASIVINAPIDKVWEYNSHNEYAKLWSVYFAKIVECPLTDCPQNQGKLQSDLGFVRRCYRRDDEKGIYWDEETIDTPPVRPTFASGQKIFVKRLRGFNFNGFIKSFRHAEYLVEQIYEVLGPNKTRLTFRSQLFDYDKLSHPVSRLTYMTWLFLGGVGVRKTRNTFVKNLINIKAAVEEGSAYRRIYPYEN